MAQTALDDLIAIYKEAQLALIKIITGNTGAGTKTYYNTILKQTEALLNRLSAQTGRYIRTEIPKEYKAALDQTYDYFKRNNLQMKRPESFAQMHSDAVSELAAEMQHHINEGISSAGRRVMRYADTARDNALRHNGLRASAVKIASGQTVRDMQKDLTQRLSEDGFLTVQYGSGKYAYQVGLDSYAAMVTRSTTREAGNLAREKQLVANGYDLVIITKHSPTCELCARVQGRVFSISGNDKRFPPLSEAFPSGYRNVHPNCRCVAVPWIEELQSPEELRAAIAKGSQPLRDERSAKDKALYTKEQAERRQLRADRLQFERYKARLGDDAPQTFSAFRRIKNEDGDRWEALQKEYRQKFEKVDIADNAKITKPVEKASAVELWETENYKNSTEKGLLILPDGTTKDFGGIEHHVTGKEEDIKLMDGATFTHNHPTDNTFSQNDIVTGLVKGNLKEMRAVTSTGDVHILVNNGATEQQRKKFNVDYQQRRMKAANTADAKIRRGEKINKDEYVKSRLETFMAEHAEEYNLSYSKTRIDVNKQSIDISEENGIIETEVKQEMNLVIDKFTPCLEDTETGELVPTVYEKATKKELSELQGWNFNWLDKDLKDSEIYKLCIVGDNNIQGLVAITDYQKDMAVYVNIAESAPHNLGKGKKYSGVGGHLFAIAAKISYDKGYGGFLFMDAKNIELVEHYRNTLGAVLIGRPHPYRMFVDEENAIKLLNTYTFEEG